MPDARMSAVMVSNTSSTPSAGWTAQRLALALLVATLLALALGLAAGSEGWSWQWQADWGLISAIRAPRSIGAWVAGALLGLGGALAQGLFRNPLADPYLLGSAAGAGLGVVLVISVGTWAGVGTVTNTGSGLTALLGGAWAGWLAHLGLVGAAFVGAMGGVSLTLLLAAGATRPMVLLLAGVVVGVLMAAVSDLLLLLSPEALRAKQVFMLGTTGFLGWHSVWLMGAALLLVLPLAMALGRVLDALVLGENTASSLGVNLPRLRLLLVLLMALCTGTTVAQAGMVAFVGLVAPHLVRRMVAVSHSALLGLSALAGGVLLLAADVAARSVIAPQELPVGVLTAVLGGIYLMVLLRRRALDAHA